jgi:hypothetical protein
VLFAAGHTGCRAAIKRRAAIAYLDKNGGPAFTHYQIDLAATLVHVSGDKPQSFAFQPATRLCFPRIAGLFGG